MQEVLSAELASRHESVIRQRLCDARFPEVNTLDAFDFPAADGISATQIHTLVRGELVTPVDHFPSGGLVEFPSGASRRPDRRSFHKS